MRLILLTLILQTISLTVCSQRVELTQFQVISHQRHVFITATLGAGSTCNGLFVERSVDSLNFVEIAQLLGVCGSINEAVTYRFSDLNPPVNQKVYYRLKMGFDQYSFIKPLKIIDLGVQSTSIRPHPLNHQSVMYFDNPTSKQAELRIYGLSGNIQKTITAIDASIFLPSYALPEGVFVYKLTLDGEEISHGKLINLSR